MDCTVKGNLPSEIFEDIKIIADNRINSQQLKNKTVFVSDCHGLIAHYIICVLLEGNDSYGNNTRVITLAKSRDDAEKQFGSLTLRKDFVVEIGDSRAFPEIERADFVINCNYPCEVAEEDCSNPEIADTIISGFANVLEYAKKSNAESVLLVSSYMIYGEVFSGKNTISESNLGYLNPTDADSAYAQSMRSAETLAVCYADKFGMNVKIARPCPTLGGVRMSDEKKWAKLIVSAAKSQSIMLADNGGEKFSFCYVSDTVSALIDILLNGKIGEAYNISNDNANVTMREFAQLVKSAVPEKNLSVVFVRREDEEEPEFSPSSPTPYVLCKDKIKSLGFSPKVTLKDGIKRSIKATELRAELRRIK